MSNLILLSNSIFEGYGKSDLTGIAYFKQWSSELAAHDYSDLLLHQMGNYPHRYALDFILSTPFLWKLISEVGRNRRRHCAAFNRYGTHSPNLPNWTQHTATDCWLGNATCGAMPAAIAPYAC